MKTYGADVNLFVDHSQVLQLECLRRGVWGTNDTWGRILTYKGQRQRETRQEQELAPAAAMVVSGADYKYTIQV